MVIEKADKPIDEDHNEGLKQPYGVQYQIFVGSYAPHAVK